MIYFPALGTHFNPNPPAIRKGEALTYESRFFSSAIRSMLRPNHPTTEPNDHLPNPLLA